MPIYIDSSETLFSTVQYDVTCRCGYVLSTREECFDYGDVKKVCPKCGLKQTVFGIVNRARFAGLRDIDPWEPGDIPVNLHAEQALDGFETRIFEPNDSGYW